MTAVALSAALGAFCPRPGPYYRVAFFGKKVSLFEASPGAGFFLTNSPLGNRFLKVFPAGSDGNVALRDNDN